MPGGRVVSFFRVQVHALVAAVLLRVARLDALDGDAEPEPPDREPGEVVEPVGAGEGNAVVGADGGGQAAFPEQALKGLDDRAFLAVDARASTGQKIARGLVGDGQRVTVAAVAEPELALEVGAPQIVGRAAVGQRRSLAPCGAAGGHA